MFIFITLERIVSWALTMGIDLSVLNSYQSFIVLIIGNIFYLGVWSFIFSICFKIVTRCFRFIF